MKNIDGENYTLSVPSDWRVIDGSSVGIIHYYEASGLVFPISFKGNPVIIVISFVKMDEKGIEEIKESIQNGYSKNTDRVFPGNFKYETTETWLQSGEKAYIINTRFYRKSKFLNQSRFDLGVFSDKYNIGYMYTISIQYSDDTYQFENFYHLKEFAVRLFSYFSFK
jgi:hypothetical protein